MHNVSSGADFETLTITRFVKTGRVRKTSEIVLNVKNR